MRRSLRDQERSGSHFAPGPVPSARAPSAGSHSANRSHRAPRRAGWAGPVLLSLAGTIFTWRTTAWRGVSAGISSWQVGLVLAFEHHLQWGPQMLFTFGPLGFVEDILPLERTTAAIALVYALGLTWALVALIMRALRPGWGLLPAAVVAWLAVVVASNLLEAPELGLGTALGLALTAIWDGTDRTRPDWVAALAALAGLQLLVELNVGLVTLGLAALAVAGGNARPRRALAGAASLVGALAIDMAISGESIGNLASYLRGSLQVTLGYNSAMGTSSGRGTEDVFALVLAVMLAATFALGLRSAPGRAKWSATLMLVGWGWEAVKEGFVRHDLHDLTFFGLVVVALALPRLPRALAPVQGAALACATVMALVANGGVVASLHSPVEDARALGTEIYDLVDGAALAPQTLNNRLELLETGDTLPASSVSALSRSTLAAEPWEVGLTYAYPQLHWDPEPVLQSYSAYTSYLDDLNARFLRSKAAPGWVLDQELAIDGQDPWWAPASTDVALMCRYQPKGRLGYWHVLARARDRCGPDRLVGVAHASFGQEVKVPEVAGALVVATFSLSSPWWARAEGFLLKPPATFATAWSERSKTTYRFLPGTANDEHVLAGAAGLGYGTNFGPAPVTALTISGGGWQRGQGSFTVKFYAVSVRRR